MTRQTKRRSCPVKITPRKDMTEEEIARYERIFAENNPQEISEASSIQSPATVPEQRKPMEDFWIEMGWCKRSRDGTIKLLRGKWKDELVREDAIRFLVEEVLQKNPRDVTEDDFNKNRLGGLLNSYYSGSPYQALIEAGYEIEPWEMLVTPNNFYKDSENRARATRWLIEKSGKKPRDITQDDFNKNRLGGLLDYYSGSPYSALREAGLVSEDDITHMISRGRFGYRILD